MTTTKFQYKKLIEQMFNVVLYVTFGVVLLFLLLVLVVIFKNSMGTMSWRFLTALPENGMKEGGIFPMLVGTVFVTFVASLSAIPVGICSGIYLQEYARDTFATRLIRMSIRNLSAVPSIVYGLFGLAIFVKTLNLGTSVLSAGLTLGLLTLPVIITTTEEALKTVPRSFKDASYALGMTPWQVLYSTTLPVALPGIMTGVILGISRAMGETAPILFTGVAFYLPSVDFNVFAQFMALPYHLYIMSTQHHDIEGVRGIAYGTASVLILLTLMLNVLASGIRYRFRRGYQGL